MRVDLEAGWRAEGKEEDHGEACLPGTIAERSEVINVGWCVDGEGVSEPVYNGIISNSPKTGGGGATHAHSAGDSLRVGKARTDVVSRSSALDVRVKAGVKPGGHAPSSEDLVKP